MAQRIQYIDLAKGISMFYIIALHTSIYLPLVYAALPMFFFLSGFFFSDKRSFKDQLKGKIWSLIIPLIIFNLVGEVYHYIESQLLTADKDYKFEFFKALIFAKNGNAPLWFLMALLLDTVFLCGILKISKNHILNLLAISGIIFVIEYYGLFSSNVYYIKSAIISMPFFYIGYFLAIIHPALKSDSRNWSDLGVGLLLLSVGAFTGYYFGDDIGFHDPFFVGNPLRFYCFTILCCIGVLYLCRFIRQVPLINYMGEFSLIVLCVHLLYVNFVLHITMKFIPEMPGMRILSLIIVTLLSIATIPFLLKVAPWAVGKQRFDFSALVSKLKKRIKID